MQFQLHAFPYVLQRFYRKDKDSSHPFSKKFILSQSKRNYFFLKLFKSLIFLRSPLQSLQTTFSIYVYILKISSKILFILHTIWTVSSIFFEVTEYELISER